MSLEDRYVNETEASAIVGFARKSLRNMRYKGDGPEYVKFNGAVRYPVSKLHEWAKTRIVKSTAEYPILERRVAKVEAARLVASAIE
jgi:hypothetical protein